MSQSHFFAHLSRLKLINRWPLMRNVRTENVSEHSLQVAMVAHALAAIKNRKFGGRVNAERIALDGDRKAQMDHMDRLYRELLP